MATGLKYILSDPARDPGSVAGFALLAVLTLI